MLTLFKKHLAPLVAVAAMAGCDPSVTLIKGFAQPESAHWHAASQRWYVSNIAGNTGTKDGVGWITSVDGNGRVEARRFVDGLDSPAGIASDEDHLYVADVDVLVTIDVASGDITERTPFPDARFLNDVALAPDGTVFVSDTGGNAIYQRRPGQPPQLLVQDDALSGPNGLLVRGDTLLIGSIGKFTDLRDEAPLFAMDLRDHSLAEVGEIRGKFDGLVLLDDRVWLTDFRGRIQVLDDTSQTLHEEKWLGPAGLVSCADFGANQDGSTLMIPDLMGGQVALFRR